jgi:hypothetical protein
LTSLDIGPALETHERSQLEGDRQFESLSLRQGVYLRLPKSASWRAAFDGAKGCVRQMEQALAERPSEPQAHFGAAVADLKVGF